MRKIVNGLLKTQDYQLKLNSSLNNLLRAKSNTEKALENVTIKWTIYILRLKTKKACKDENYPDKPAFKLINLMKSCFAGWNPNKFGWNLRCSTSDEIKSASPVSLWLGHARGKTILNRFLTLSRRFATLRSKISSQSDFIHASGFIPT